MTLKPPFRDTPDESRPLENRSPDDRERLSLLHELQVYQEELLAQNEELTRAQNALEETRDRFIELFDFAPNGYLTLDGHGLIQRINLTGASFIGKPRQNIEGMPLLGFVVPEWRTELLGFLRRCRALEHGPAIMTELALRCADGQKEVQLICKQRGATSDGDGAEYFTALIDITERRRLEGERTKAAREHAALARRLLSVQDEERQRIARDLHDNIGQQVTSLRLMLDLIAMASIDDGVRARVTQSQSIVEQLDRQLDFITGELRPASLDLGMTAAIRQFVDEWAATFGIVAEFRGEGTEELRLKPEAETHLYRVVQEALNNVYKHARATRVSVSLECKGHEVFLVVEDDGHGFDAAGLADSQNRGLGLVGMRERAQIVGGSIDIQSRAARRGTRISVRVPVD